MDYLSAQEYRHIVRIVGNDILGEKKIVIGLTQIKGIGYNFACAILDTVKINTNSSVGNLTEENVQAIEKLITDPLGANFSSLVSQQKKRYRDRSRLASVDIRHSIYIKKGYRA